MLRPRPKRKKQTLRGERFGSLVVVDDLPSEKVETRNGKTVYYYMHLCQCDCGNMVKVQRSNLISGNTTSCGCVRKAIRTETIREVNRRRPSPCGGIYARPNGYYSVVLKGVYYGRYRSYEDAKDARDKILQTVENEVKQ